MSPDPNRQRPRLSKKRRAVQAGATPHSASPADGRRPATQRARGGATRGGPASSGLSTAWLVVIGVVVFAIGAALAGGVFKFGSGAGGGAGSSATGSSPAASAIARGTNCPTAQPPPAPAGQSRLATIDTTKGKIEITLKANLAPIAVGNFAALAACGYYNGIVFHRVATLQDGTPFVIQGGDPTGTGGGGPGYEIQDEQVTTPYVRGTVAMARTSQPNSVGSQFFIVLDDKDQSVLASANTYQIIGSVTAGMDTVDAIYADAQGQESPAHPIAMTTVTVGPWQAAASTAPSSAPSSPTASPAPLSSPSPS